jgi:CRP-like cAMP-binding protein
MLYSKLIFNKNSKIFLTQGEKAEKFFIIISGEVSLLQNKEFTERKSNIFTNCKTYKNGASFGQDALLHNNNQELSALAIKDCYLAYLRKKHFLDILCKANFLFKK